MGIGKKAKSFHEVFILPRELEKLCEYIKDEKRRRKEFRGNIDGLVIKSNSLVGQILEKKIIAFKY